MRQVRNRLTGVLSGALAVGAALAFAGCGGGGGGGGGGSASTAAGVTSGTGSGELTALSISPPGDLVVDDGMGSGFQVIVDGYYRDGEILDLTRDVSLKVADETVAKIGGDGLISPIAPGTTEVSVSMQSVTGETLTVTKSITVVAAGAAPSFQGGQLKIYPEFRTLGRVDAAAGKDQLQQLVIVGTDASGRMWDLTRTNGVTLTDMNRNPSVAGQLSPTGLFRGVVDGEQVLLVTRIDSAGLVAGSQLVLGSGSAHPVPPSALYSGAPLSGSTNPIDQTVLAALRGQFIEPSGLVGDDEFLRRLYSDALGRLPTVAEQGAFKTSQAPNKRDAEVDRVVGLPEFATHWGHTVGEWFEVGAGNAAQFDAWATAEIQADHPLSDVVSGLAAGTSTISGTFDQIHPRASDKVDVLMLVATGMTAKCAVCHDHPLTGANDSPKWVQDERYALDAFFAANATEATKLNKNAQRFGNPLQPGWAALDATKTVTSTLTTPIAQRRAEFAGLLTSSAQFDRGMAHRIYSSIEQPLLDPNQFLQKNLDAVTVPALLDTLAQRFRADNTVLRAFVAEIFKSKAYQLSAEGKDTTNDPLLARHVLVRTPSECVESMVQTVTGMPVAANELDFFRRTFGYPVDRVSISERSGAVNMSQSLVLMNSPIVQAKVSSNTGSVAALAGEVTAGTKTQDQAITQLFRAALSRDPTADELTDAQAAVAGAPNVRAGLEDVAAVLMSTIEAVAH
jgi:hypothetical protein